MAKQEKDTRRKTYDLSFEFRSIFLHSMIQLERKMDIFISIYFCKDSIRRREMCELLLFTEKITLDNKRMIFNNIIQNRYNELP